MKAIVSFLLMVTVLFISVHPAYAQGDRIEKALVKAFKDANRTAIRDAKGKVTQIEIEYFSPKQTLELGYDKDILSSVTLGDGTKMTILRNETGRFDGFVFPDGSKALFLWKKSPNFDFSLPAGLKSISPSGKETILPLTGGSNPKELTGSFSKVAFLVDDESDCQFAVAAAAGAVANAAVACASDSATCITASAIAAVAVANAVRVCRRILPEENQS